MMDLSDLSLAAASEQIRHGELSPVALVEFFLERIRALDPDIRAWAHVAEGSALAAAQGLDDLRRAGTWLGPLHGIPIGIKDTFDTAGIPTEAGSLLRKGVVPVRDAAVVATLKRQGAIILGKTACTELGHAFPGPTRNPWNLDHTPGGSSSGSAAALAARMCLGAVGSQTMGSIVRPAAYCGVVGAIGTVGRLSPDGMVPLAPTLDTPGPMAKSVRDAALLFRALTEQDHVDPSSSGARFRARSRVAVGVAPGHFRDLDNETQHCFDEAVWTLGGLGHPIKELALPKTFDALNAVAQVIAHAEAAALQLDTFRERPTDYSETYRRSIHRGLLVPAASYVRALRIRTAATGEIIQAYRHAGIDVLVTPASLGPAPRGLASTGDPSFNAPFTVLGLPALTVPMGFVDGLPVGLQIIGLPFHEDTLFEVASRYEAAAGWTRYHPDPQHSAPDPPRADPAPSDGIGTER